jgi:hypothetical protein
MTTRLRERVAGTAPAPVPTRVRRPFVWLKPQRVGDELPDMAEHGLAYLQIFAEADTGAMMRALVRFSIEFQSPSQRPFVRAPGISVLNRRRRAALLWINSILDGDVSNGTLRQVTNVWLPQLAGCGHEVERAARRGGAFIEFVRGLMTASIFDQGGNELLRHAKALYALETVLGAHLRAIQLIASGSVG